MRRIVSKVAVIAMLVGLVIQAMPANAVAGYDSAYSGESAFLTLGLGESGSFTVFFANTGSTTWTLGNASQVDLAACRADKVSCDAQDSSDAAFNSGWRSSTRYAAHTQTSVAPGQIGTFTYSVQVPNDAAAGTYRFNGAVVLSSTGQDIHNEGYFQDVTVTTDVADPAPDAQPEFTSVSAQGQAVTMRFSEPVCAEDGTLTANTEVRVRVNGEDTSETSIDFTDCADNEFSETATLRVTEAVAEGDEVVVTITTTGADDIFDQDDNAMELGHSETAIAEADETDPSISSATASDEQTLRVVYTEPVECAGTDPGQFIFDPDAAGENDVAAIDVDCDGTSTVLVDFPTNTFAAGVTGTVKYVADDDPIEDLSGNNAPDQSLAIMPTDAADPTIEDASITSSAGFRNSADADDEITILFSEVMDQSTSGDVFRVQDGDGTIADIKCGNSATADNAILDAACDYTSDKLVLTLREDATGEVITAGDTPGIQWPAEIIDTANVVDEEDEAVDLRASADTTIE